MNNNNGMIRIPTGQAPIGQGLMPRESAAPGAEHHLRPIKTQATGTLPQGPVQFFKNPKMNIWNLYYIHLKVDAEKRFQERGIPNKLMQWGIDMYDAVERIKHIIRPDEIEGIEDSGEQIWLPANAGLEQVPNGQQTRI